MQFFIFEKDGDYNLPEVVDSVSWIARRSDSTVLAIVKNDEPATLTIGFEDSAGDFCAFPNGTITEGKKIEHGHGCRLMVQISGLEEDNKDSFVELGLSTYKN